VPIPAKGEVPRTDDDDEDEPTSPLGARKTNDATGETQKTGDPSHKQPTTDNESLLDSGKEEAPDAKEQKPENGAPGDKVAPEQGNAAEVDTKEPVKDEQVTGAVIPPPSSG